MCIIFIYNGDCDDQSDYKMILISNRDEYFDRPTKNMSIWSQDPAVIAGRDLQAEGDSTWLAVSPTNRKIGVLLNLPGFAKENALSRGKVVVDYIRNTDPVHKYVDQIKQYSKSCNGFIFISVEYSETGVSTFTYDNANDELKSYNNTCIGFSNSLPDTPLMKTYAGEVKMEQICSEFNKENMEKDLMENLIDLLKTEQSHLPDKILENRHPNVYKELSSIYVRIPQRRYGTRTHTIVLLTKKGRLSITELALQMPIDPENPIWNKIEFNYDDISKQEE